MLIFIKKTFLKETKNEHFGPNSIDDYSFQILFLLQILLLRVKQEFTVWRGFGFNPEPFYGFTKSLQFCRVLMEPKGGAPIG